MTETTADAGATQLAELGFDEALLADEVVTHAKFQAVRSPVGDFSFGLITLDNGSTTPSRTPSAPRVCLELDAALDQAAAADIKALAITGKPFIFAVGPTSPVSPRSPRASRRSPSAGWATGS